MNDHRLYSLFLSLAFLSCSSPIDRRVAAGLIAACPPADLASVAARAACADGLTAFEPLRFETDDPIVFGAQSPDVSLSGALDDAPLLLVNPRMMRRVFLSLFAYQGPARFESAPPYRVARVPIRFRVFLPKSEYHGPIWQNPGAASRYSQSKEMLFFFRDDRLTGVLLGADIDPSRPVIEGERTGSWFWDGGREPHTAMPRHLFSPSNPFAAAVERSYRALAVALEEQRCFECHGPGNPVGMHRFSMLFYPNAALPLRHSILRRVSQGRMPPQGGIADPMEKDAFLEIARAFADAGDRALEWDGERR